MNNTNTWKFWRQGEPWVWATGMALALVILLTVTLFGVVAYNGLAVFWPRQVVVATIADGSRVMGEVTNEEEIHGTQKTRLQFKIGNRDLGGLDFKWVDVDTIVSMTTPEQIYVLERQEFGNFYGSLKELHTPGLTPDTNEPDPLAAALDSMEKQRDAVTALNQRISNINQQAERLEHQLAVARHRGEDGKLVGMLAEERELRSGFDQLVTQLTEKQTILTQNTGLFVDANGQEKSIALAQIVRAYRPNAMPIHAKAGYYVSRLGELLFDEPREANTEGGLFPAIFGTIMLILLMSLLSFPLGVVAGIYLREYAKEGYLVKMVRIAVNNLAGIPSIVYGIFGLGFFVYGIGGQLDQLLFAERLPTPTFGTGGILWASLTLGLLTVPVVIVATEEALGAIPPGIREGSQALAATKFQTLTRILLPMASPGILTGFILAMARAAGEVAPLMITGVVKLAPALPLDGTFPYVHLDRKFMHLGFHIYDVGFQSPNVEAAKPMVYVTTLLLILIVFLLTSTAIRLRNRMRERYSVID